jgi:hypothetical protein
VARIFLVEKDAINFDFQTSYHIAPASPASAILVCTDQEPHRPTGVKLVEESKPQLDKFKEAARELETDDDPQRFRDRLGKLVKHKPVEKPD